MTRLRWAWLLCLALLVPMAQVAGSLHELSHIGTTSSPHEGTTKGAAHPDACGLCTMAAAIGTGAAPASHAAQLIDAPFTFALPHSRAQHAAATWPHFLSRAPPASLS